MAWTRKKQVSIRWRLWAFLGILVFAFLLAILMSSRILENNMLNVRVSEMAQKANDFSLSVSYDFENHNARELYASAVSEGMELNGRVLILDTAGVVQIDSFSRLNGSRLLHTEVQEVLSGEKGYSYGFHKVESGEERNWCINSVSAISANSQLVGAVVLVQSVQDVVQSVQEIQVGYYVIYLVVLAVLVALFSVLINRILHPLRALKEGTQSISRGEFSRRVQVEGRDELATLADAFNDMAERLEDVDRSRSEFISNASHELKTPITSMKILTESILYEEGLEEAVYKEFLGDIDHELDRMTGLINDLLLMTKLQNMEDAKAQMERVSLGEMVRDVVRKIRPIAAKKQITMEMNLRYEEEVDCMPMHLSHAISNLVENAVKYTAEGGEVYVSTVREGGHVQIAVQDTGEGIAQKDIEKIFERFYRVSKSRTRETGGTGLGLHIVQTVALLHDGRVTVESEEGKGSTFTFMLPLHTLRHERRDA